MIRNRPHAHEEMEHYKGLPSPPYRVDVEKIPDLIRSMLFPLRHVEPLTMEAIRMAGDVVEDFPNKKEFGLYEQYDTKFQLIFVVINSIYSSNEGDCRLLYPYSISLIPASKRGEVEESAVGFVRLMTGNPMLGQDTAYLHLDPFVGEWGAWSDLGLIAEMGQNEAYTDELGLVYDYYYLRTDAILSEVVQPAISIDDKKMSRFLRHRAKLLYAPFRKLETRRIWGVENALELFLLHEMVRRNVEFPIIQARVYEDGFFPTLYHAWSEWGDDMSSAFISEVDFLFESSKVVVFCDGARHNKKKVKERDARIDQRLSSIGYKVVRLPSGDILRDVSSAADRVMEQL